MGIASCGRARYLRRATHRRQQNLIQQNPLRLQRLRLRHKSPGLLPLEQKNYGAASRDARSPIALLQAWLELHAVIHHGDLRPLPLRFHRDAATFPVGVRRQRSAPPPPSSATDPAEPSARQRCRSPAPSLPIAQHHLRRRRIHRAQAVHRHLHVCPPP